MPYKNIIFDLDGTLIDSAAGVVEAVNYSLEQMGEPRQEHDTIASYIGYPLSKMYPHFTDKPVKELYKHFQIKAEETVVPSAEILPGVSKILTSLHSDGYKMAIATTKIKRHLNGIIEKFNWGEIFPVYSAGSEVKRVKPFPDIIHLTLKRLKANPDETIVVGDTINDVKAAQSVPVKVAAVVSPYGGKDDLVKANPDYLIDSLSQLFEILNGR